MTAAARTGAAFDAIAGEYDAVFTESPIGRAQRRAVWEIMDRVFRPGEHILELNCGTGVDALHMAERGLRVHACDASQRMIEIARGRMRRTHAPVRVEQRSCEELGGVSGVYDGVLSNFGGLNCLESITGLVAHLEPLVRPGSSVLLCYMGPVCAWETLWYLAHGQPRKAFRRWRKQAVTAQFGNGECFLVRYPAVRNVIRAFAPEFRLAEWQGVGVFVPPSYVDRFARKHPRALEAARRLDRVLARRPAFRGIGDHVLLRFEKVDE